MPKISGTSSNAEDQWHEYIRSQNSSDLAIRALQEGDHKPEVSLSNRTRGI
jgi:hypothetical protein